MKRLTLREAYLMTRIFGHTEWPGSNVLDAIYCATKASLYKLGFDIALAHDYWFRDPTDCPECMTDDEWKSSKYRHLYRLGDWSNEEQNARGIPVPREGCDCEANKCLK